MAKALRKYGLFLIIPGIVLWNSVLLKLAAGPYWLATNLDPSYQYFVNGLYLIKGIVPNHHGSSRHSVTNPVCCGLLAL